MRGQIKNRKRRQQIIDFSGLHYKNITPTDIDGLGEFYHISGFFEIREKVFVFIELKLEGAPIEIGQELAFIRIIDNLRKPSIYILAEHNVFNHEEDISGHLCLVNRYYVNSLGEWQKPKKQITVKELVDKFLEHHKLYDYLKTEFDN